MYKLLALYNVTREITEYVRTAILEKWTALKYYRSNGQEVLNKTTRIHIKLQPIYGDEIQTR
jgi:hypothetical protein